MEGTTPVATSANLSPASSPLGLDAISGAAAPSFPEPPTPLSDDGIQLCGKVAMAPAEVPAAVLAAVTAGNRLQTKYYKWGGGRVRAAA